MSAISLSYRFYKLFYIKTVKIIRRYNVQVVPDNLKSIKVMGIETSCDDTGCAVVDGAGNVLGDAVYSQNAVHIRYGGVNPIFAHELHRENMEPATNHALCHAKLNMNNIDAIAVTTKPGLRLSLQVGVKYANFIAKKHKKPLIPIHHMEAHAILARMYYNIPFPYLVLLLSGGHCLIAVVRDVNDFLLLGQSLDNAPGEIMDKAARRMKLRNIPLYSKMAGGAAIELAAKNFNNPEIYKFPTPLVRNRDCNFSFSGLKDSLVRKLVKKEKEHKVMGDEIIPEVNDLCAAFQLALAEHIFHRTERAVLFCEKYELISADNKSLVVSGGVACNNFIFQSLQHLGEKLGYNVYRPPPEVCTDNGVMIAWNGIEKLRIQEDVVSYIDLKHIEPVCPLGYNISEQVKTANLQTKVTRLKRMYLTN